MGGAGLICVVAGFRRSRAIETPSLCVFLEPSWPEPLRWAVEFLREYFSDPPCRFHVELMSVLTEPGKRLVARVAPRGHAKSTCAALAYPLWCICTRRRRNIVITTHEAGLATQFVRDIRQELEANEHILAAYPELCDGPSTDDIASAGRPVAAQQRVGRAPATRRTRRTWSQTRFTTSTGVTVQAKGRGAGFRGLRTGPYRPDLIICDDLENDLHVRRPEGRLRLEQWLRRVVMPALAPGGQLLVLGSILHHDSLLASLSDRQRFPGWDYAVYRALESERGPDGEFHRVALWPARWPVARLDEERDRIGVIAFEQEYQANPAEDAARIFRPEWLKPYDLAELVPERLANIVAVDPATGTTTGDFFALWVGSVDRDTKIIYTRQLTLERIHPVVQVERIVAAFKQWRPLLAGIETNAYQSALKDMVEMRSRQDGLYVPIESLPSAGGKKERVAWIAPLLANGTFRLPPALDPEAESQFFQFPNGAHDDAPDVCTMGVNLARVLQNWIGGGGPALPSRGSSRKEGW